MSLPEKEPTYRDIGKSGLIMFVVLLLAIICIAFTVYLKRQDIQIMDVNLIHLVKGLQSEKRMAEAISDIKYESREHPLFGTYKGYIIKYSNQCIRALSKNGEEVWSLSVAVDNPVIKNSGDFLMIADIGGKTVCVLKGKEKKWELTLDNEIINADISDDGYVSVVHKTKNYKGAVSVYDVSGNKIFTTYIGERYVIAAKVSPSGKQMVINSIDTSGVSISTSVEFTDMLGKSLGARYTRQNEFCPQIWYMDESVICASDTSITCLEKDKPEKWKQEFESKSVLASGVCLDKYAVVAVSAEHGADSFNKATDIRIYNAEGHLYKSYRIDGIVKSMVTLEDVIAANTGSEIYFLNVKGELKSKYASKTEIEDVCFINPQEAVAVSRGSLTIIKI